MHEFELIGRYFAQLTGPEGLKLKDDAALVAGGPWVITTDTLIAGVHFLGSEKPELIARKALRCNLSDLAAMGAAPRYYLLNASFPADTEKAWVKDFAKGLKADQREYGISLIGGDTTHTPGPLTLSVTALGKTGKKPLLRSNARAGEDIYVSGTIGDAALGLQCLRGEEGEGLSEAHIRYLQDRYLLPQPRVKLGDALQNIASACMDVSDGLMQDLSHMCKASKVGAGVQAELLPLSPAARAIAHTDPLQWTTMVAGGDDYELLFTAPVKKRAALMALGKKLKLPLTRIGTVTKGKAVQLMDAQGKEIKLTRTGYRHF